MAGVSPFYIFTGTFSPTFPPLDAFPLSWSKHQFLEVKLSQEPFFFFVFLPFLGPLPRHMEVPRLGVELELQLPASATATATATRDPSRVCDPHHSSGQRRTLNPLSKARDRTRNLMGPSRLR